MRKLKVFLLLMMCFAIIAPVLAQTLDPGENWCFDGGPLEGRCTTDDPAETSWYWLYGFFRAQIAKGALSINDIPVEYQVGFTDSGTSKVDAIRDADGNIVAGRSANFNGSIATCRYSKSHLYISVTWLNLDIAGDKIEISTEEGSVSRNMYVPTGAVNVEFRIGDPAESITSGGTMRVYYRGVLIGKSDLNGLFHCEDDT